MPENVWITTAIIAGFIFALPGLWGTWIILRKKSYFRGGIFLAVTVGLEITLLAIGRKSGDDIYRWATGLTPAGILATVAPLLLAGFTVFFLWALDQKR